MAVSQGEIRAGAAYVELLLRDKLTTALNQIAGKLQAFGAKVRKLGSGVFGGALPGPLQEVLRMAMSPAGAFAGFQAAAKIWAEAGHDLATVAAKTGLTVAQLSGLKYAAEASGSSVESLAGGIGRMQKALVAAAKDGGAPAEALEQLTLTVRDFAGLDAQGQFLLLADRLAEIPDPALRGATALKIFGKGAGDLLPLIVQGKAGIVDLVDEADRLGFIMGGEAAKGAEELHQKFRLVERATSGIVKAIGQAVAVMQGQLLDKVLSILLGVRDWIKANQAAVASIAKIITLVVAGGTALVVFGGVISAAATVFTALATAATFAATCMAAILSPFGLAIAAAGGLAAAGIGAAGGFAKAWEWLQAKLAGVVKVVKTALSAIWNALSGGEVGKAWAVIATGFGALWAQVKAAGIQAWTGIRDFAVNSFWAAWEAIRAGLVSAIAAVGHGLVAAIDVFVRATTDLFAGVLKMAVKMGAITRIEAFSYQVMFNLMPTGLRGGLEQWESGQRGDIAAGQARRAHQQAHTRELREAVVGGPVGEAQRKWQEAVAAANAVAPQRRKGAWLKPGEAFDLDAIDKKSGTSGTFSARAAEAMGRGSVAKELIDGQKVLIAAVQAIGAVLKADTVKAAKEAWQKAADALGWIKGNLGAW